MPCFFRELAGGMFDEADLLQRASELAAFVTAARARYRIAQPIAVGFSHGANMAAALLLLYPNLLAGAILLRPVPPLTRPPEEALSGTPVLLLSGAADTIASPAAAATLALMLRARGAAATEQVVSGGHDLSQADLSAAYGWMRQNTRFDDGV
ncbi:MAG: alpha/beta fold hydrolase [Acetobacteraceae bacterium]